MKIYLAGRFRHRDALADQANAFEQAGHHITSRWLREPYELLSDSVRATDDEQDVAECDVLILLSEGGSGTARGSGGRHVEFGMARALGKRIVVVGDKENVFHSLPGVLVCSDWPAVSAVLNSMERDQ